MYNNLDDTIDYNADSESYVSHQNMMLLHSSHKGFRQVKRRVGRKTIQLVYFITPYVPDSKIVNAVTGIRYRHDDPKCKYVVGSIQEDLFFKVSISNGENGQDPVLLFYDSPEQYEKHQFTTLNQTIKEQWLNKKMVYIRRKHLQKDNEYKL